MEDYQKKGLGILVRAAFIGFLAYEIARQMNKNSMAKSEDEKKFLKIGVCASTIAILALVPYPYTDASKWKI